MGSIFLLALIGWGAWYFLNRKKDNTTAENTQAQTVVPPVAPDTIHGDTNQAPPQKKDTIVTAVSNPDSYTFKVVFKETIDVAAATAKMKDLIARGHKVIMYTSDSLYYKLAEPYKLPLSDTARVRDSLNKYYYNGKGYIELF